MVSDKIQGKVVLVTGANRGIGKAIVDGFVQHGASKVYAAVRTLSTADALVHEHNSGSSGGGGNRSSNAAAATKIVPIYMDLSKPETIVDCAKVAQDVDIVVNNAGVLMNNSNPLDKVAIENLDLEMKVNVHGLLHVAQAFAPILMARKGSVFVQINSVGSFRSAAQHVSTYSATKAAAYSLTQSLRMSLKDHGVTVLSVHPGPIATDMIAAAGLVGTVPSRPPEAPSQVADAIVEAIQSDDDIFHIYPDSKSRALGRVYQSFAETVIEPCPISRINNRDTQSSCKKGSLLHLKLSIGLRIVCATDLRKHSD
jgi:NAD(P)-dependent dehydrogenase (short-subunit alcohol dehydrogenase family)